jgi:imidazolonepropionase-like amidohydrolase
VVMPGFVDCHTHLALPPLGGSDADDQSAARHHHRGSQDRLRRR